MKFKVGDKVKYIGKTEEIKDEIGIVRSIRKDNEMFQCVVMFNNFSDDYNWLVQEDVLELVQKNINSDEKDLIRNLINKYLSDNETSIREELFLKRFQDYCFEKLGDE